MLYSLRRRPPLHPAASRDVLWKTGQSHANVILNARLHHGADTGIARQRRSPGLICHPQQKNLEINKQKKSKFDPVLQLDMHDDVLKKKKRTVKEAMQK